MVGWQKASEQESASCRVVSESVPGDPIFPGFFMRQLTAGVTYFSDGFENSQHGLSNGGK